MRGLVVLRPRRRHGGVPRPRARRRPRLLGAARRVRRGARVRLRRRASRARPRAGYDSLTALVLAGALAGGVVLASDVFHSGGQRRRPAVRQPARARPSATSSWRARGWAAPPRRRDGRRNRAALARAGVRPRRGTRARPALRQDPDALLLVARRGHRGRVGDAVGALLATALLAVGGRRCGSSPQAARRAGGRRGRSRSPPVEGVAGLWPRCARTPRRAPAIAVLGGGHLRGIARLASRIAVARARPGRAGRRTAVMLALVLSACGGGASSASSGPDVVATTTQIGDWARAVGGDAVARAPDPAARTPIRTSTSRGPHDVEAVADAKLVFESGDGLDALDGRRSISNAGGSPRVVDLGAKRARAAGGRERPRRRASTPTWRHDPQNAKAAVTAIRDTLAATKPERPGPRTARNADRLPARSCCALDARDRWVGMLGASRPPSQRKLVTDHDASLKTSPTATASTSSAPSSHRRPRRPSHRPATSPSSCASMRREHVRAIFPESSLSAEARRADRARDGRDRPTPRSTATRSARADSRGATYLVDGARRMPTR